MGNEIKVKVGVQSDVKPGMDKAVNDVRKGADRMRESIDKSMRGKGFKEVFMRAVHGDISGAFEELQERLSGNAKSFGAKLGITIAGALTAALAGWQAGKALDEKFGISDKIGTWIGNKLTAAPGAGLGAEGDAAKAANRERWAKEESDKQGREAFLTSMRGAAQSAIQGEINARKAAIDALEAEADAINEAIPKIREEAETFGDAAAMRDAANAAADRAADHGVDREMQRSERAQARRNAREERRSAMAESAYKRLTGHDIMAEADPHDPDKALAAVGKLKGMPRWQRLELEAGIKRRAADFAAENIDERKRRAEEAAIESRNLLKQIKDSQEALRSLEAQLLTLKG